MRKFDNHTIFLLIKDQCTIGVMKGRCDCNKYEVCLSGQWEEATVPNNEKYVTICGNCTADDTRNGCSSNFIIETLKISQDKYFVHIMDI